MFECSPVYYANEQSKADIIINQGGTDSGKTYAIIQLLFTYALTPDAPKEDPLITIVAESVPNLKAGAYRIAQSIYLNTPEVFAAVSNWNKTDMTFYFKTGWIMEFKSYETEQQAKQGKRQYSFFNEANGISYPIFWQVAKRTRRQTFIDYNPSASFWPHEKLIGTTKESNDLGADVKLIISDHRHNPFLSEKEHARTEGIKDKDLWWVYARGRTGNLTGLIYPNWRQIPDDQFPDVDYFWGLDFGYTNDETALTKCAIVGNNFFIHECLYETGAPARRVKEILSINGYKNSEVVYCDHDKEQIYQLRQLGIVAVPANKGNGSIKGGIMKIGEFKVFYTSSSKNIHEERIRYMWEIDKITGKPTNQPKGGFDHCFVAETLITMADGSVKKIIDIEEGDYVHTSNGAKKVLIKWNNGVQPVFEYALRIADYYVYLKCTNNHLIKIEDKWLEISKLESGMTVTHIKTLITLHTSYTQEKDILHKADGECTSECMNISMEKFQKGCIYITKTKTNGITGLKTWKLRKQKNTLANIQKIGLKITQPLQSNFRKKGFGQLLNGINQKQVSSGIKNTQNGLTLVKSNMEHPSANNALANTLKRNQHNVFAGVTASKNGGDFNLQNGQLTSASIAGMITKDTIIEKKHVLKNVQQSYVGKRNVYDLTIEDSHEYFANGILVHNCLDSLRMALYTKFFRQGV